MSEFSSNISNSPIWSSDENIVEPFEEKHKPNQDEKENSVESDDNNTDVEDSEGQFVPRTPNNSPALYGIELRGEFIDVLNSEKNERWQALGIKVRKTPPGFTDYNQLGLESSNGRATVVNTEQLGTSTTLLNYPLNDVVYREMLGRTTDDKLILKPSGTYIWIPESLTNDANQQ